MIHIFRNSSTTYPTPTMFLERYSPPFVLDCFGRRGRYHNCRLTIYSYGMKVPNSRNFVSKTSRSQNETHSILATPTSLSPPLQSSHRLECFLKENLVLNTQRRVPQSYPQSSPDPHVVSPHRFALERAA